MQLSWQYTMGFLIEERDEEALRIQECMWDLENSASRNCEGRIEFYFYTTGGVLLMEGRSK
jgi:hypothetical protein